MTWLAAFLMFALICMAVLDSLAYRFLIDRVEELEFRLDSAEERDLRGPPAA
jgi:hypothetical protein